MASVAIQWQHPALDRPDEPRFVRRGSARGAHLRDALGRWMDQPKDAPAHPSSPDRIDLAQRLTQTYVRGAKALEQSARLAEDHAHRSERQGQLESAKRERAEAAKARDAAARYRAKAELPPSTARPDSS